ncbi:Glucoamylase P [Phlyctema vagabunda]|uniref:Glucoamylase n=1 Tax=Phlyctema vagabunda TaxID=108571 RepID=A0ABR4P9K8_9HELO
MGPMGFLLVPSRVASVASNSRSGSRIGLFAMHLLSLPSALKVVSAAPLLLCCSSVVLAAPGTLHSRDVSSFIAVERPFALQSALNNIGPNGSAVPGAGAGFVVASPSKVDPDYFFTWSRDAALTLKMIVDEFIFGNQALQPYIEDYLRSQAVLQTVSNPSGTFLPSGLGLGEPKYQVDGTRFNGAWGRPQRDGPALRATALITYSNYLIKNGQSKYVKTVIWPVISNDLSYVGQYWNQTGFDLWEEINGSSFFTLQQQHKSLVEGSLLAQAIGVTCTGCDQAPQVLCFLQNFWNGKYIDANINVDDGRTGLDGNTILGSIAAFDIDAYCDSPTFQPCHSKSLATFKEVIDSFRKAYAINAGIPKNQGVAVGRYTEDVYFNGNPWYLITVGAAEFLYDAVAQWKARHNLVVDGISLAFFKDLYPEVEVRKYNSGNENSPFAKIMDAVTAYADSFVAVAQKYTPADGSLSEQFDRATGAPLSARDLTWSYAAFVTMAERRAGQYPETWGVRKVAPAPATCAGSSTLGVYVPATAAGAPNVTTFCTVNIRLEVNASTYFGENLYVVGNTTDLGNWDLASSQPLNPGLYTAARPLWYADLQLAAGQSVDYKFVRTQNCNQPPVYESTNRTLAVPACGQPGFTTDFAWNGPVGSPGNCSASR